jgi:hypothetical protein
MKHRNVFKFSFLIFPCWRDMHKRDVGRHAFLSVFLFILECYHHTKYHGILYEKYADVGHSDFVNGQSKIEESTRATNQPTPWSKIETFPTIYIIRIFIILFTIAYHLSLFWVALIQSSSYRFFSLRSILITSLHLCLNLHAGFSLYIPPC